MRLKKKIRDLVSLSRRTGGFTLVELVVVIAILGVLAGVAVPAYGGYVKKANTAADISLVSDVANAMELGFYSGKIKEGGLAVLKSNGITASGDGVEEAMEDVFGAGWSDLALKADCWTTAETAEIVVGSSYLSNGRKAEDLLESVSILTNMAASAMGSSDAQALVDSGFVDADFLNGIPAGAQVGTSAYQNAVGNLLVLHVAEEIAKFDPESDEKLSEATQLALDYAALYAYYSNDTQNGAQKIEELNGKIAVAAASGNGRDKLDALNAVVERSKTAEVDDAFCGNNELAFMEIMKAANDLSNNIMSAGDVTSNDMWVSEGVVSAVGGYFDAMEAISGLNPGESGVIIMVDREGKVDTNPSDIF